ncbi:MAG: glutamine-synthetase adenylyltransferase, partial [Comamonas sp.]
MQIADPIEPSIHMPAAAHSRFWQRLHRRYADVMTLLPSSVPYRKGMEQVLQQLMQQHGLDLSAGLRVLRQLVMARLMELDCEGQADMGMVTRSVTELAELALDHACRQVRQELDARHGAPTGPDQQHVPLWIVGMGKFGARELNVSSDIDLIYVYEHEGETQGLPDGRGKISNHEYFGKAVKAIYTLIGDTTEHGFVFRVDLALRPHGNSGAAAISLSSLEDYLQVHGREWERFAWLKSRVVAPLVEVQAPNVQALRSVVLPFVFRKYLDYSVFDSLRTLHRQIREHAARRSAGHPERANDVKLSRGGIR